MSEIANTLYYSVIFSNQRTDDDHGYAEIAARMAKLAAQQPSYLGMESDRENLGMKMSYLGKPVFQLGRYAQLEASLR